jgi:hypothetical protein
MDQKRDGKRSDRYAYRSVQGTVDDRQACRAGYATYEINALCGGGELLVQQVSFRPCLAYLDYLQRLPLNFSPYITFLRHIINISSPTFSSLAAVPSIFSPYTPLQL